MNFLTSSRQDTLLDELELLELGECRNVLGQQAMSPARRSEAWQECFILSKDKTKYCMFDEKTGELMFTAKRHGKNFYISQYDDFPETFTGPKAQTNQRSKKHGSECEIHAGRSEASFGEKYCSVLKLNKSGYKLYSCSCELCDNKLSKFSCGTLESGEERQVLALVSHKTTIIDETDIEARCLDVQLPAVDENTLERVIWCPRTRASGTQMFSSQIAQEGSANNEQQYHKCKNNNNLIEEEKEEEDETKYAEDCDSNERSDSSRNGIKSKTMAKQHSTGIPPTRKNCGRAAPSATNNCSKTNAACTMIGDKHVCSTRLPRWDSDIGSLVLKFRGGRVLQASSKNFVLVDKANPDNMIFQLGKVESGKFNLDFKHPVSPLQAFGVALSAYGFVPK